MVIFQAEAQHMPDPETPHDPAEGRPDTVAHAFSVAARWTSLQSGRASTFIIAGAMIAIWAITGPLFGFSDTWQLVINTGTNIVTFLMVFLIQNTQNRDMWALHLKLDELIRVNKNARAALLDLDGLTEAEFERLQASVSKRVPDSGRFAREDAAAGG